MSSIIKRIRSLFREDWRDVTVHHARGLFGSRSDKPSTQDIKNFYDYYSGDNADPSVGAAVDSLAGGAVGRGYDLEPAVREDEDGYEDALQAKRLCDELGEKQNLDKLVPNIVRNMLVAGFLPVESIITAVPGKAGLYIIDPVSVTDLKWNTSHTKPERIEQTVDMQKKWIDMDRLAWFVNNPLRNSWYGQSIVKPVSTLLGYRSSALIQMNKILERYASPKGIWGAPSDSIIQKIQTAIQGADDAEDIFLGDLPQDFDLRKIVRFLEIDPRVRFWEYIQYIDQLIFVGLMAPSLFYFKDATEASARVLLEIVDRKQLEIARNVKREIEARWFTPLCTLNHLEQYVPRIVWRQRPSIREIDIPEILRSAIAMGQLYRGEILEILGMAGFKLEYTPTPADIATHQLLLRRVTPMGKAGEKSTGDDGADQ